jgi:non-canonical (house-cleaning) NTP pyrophosphatase
MKVLKPGRQQAGWATEAKCSGKGNGGGGCGAELLVEQTDLFRTSSSHYDGSTDYYNTFKCPNCGVKTDLENVPSDIARALKTEGERIVVKPNPIGKRNTPISIGVAGTSLIKIAAVETIRTRRSIHASVNGIVNSSSGVNEQPYGKAEIIRGAINRILTAWEVDPRFEIYFGIENGIEHIDGTENPEEFLDFAVCAMFIPEYGVFQLMESEKCLLPLNAVIELQKRGMRSWTIGKVMQEMGLVKDHADPHFELMGKHRSEILSDTIEHLFDRIPQGIFLPAPNSSHN